jgi:hypothetical protein
MPMTVSLPTDSEDLRHAAWDKKRDSTITQWGSGASRGCLVSGF